MNSNHYMQRLARAAQRLTCAAGVRATMALLLLLVTSTTAWAQSLDGWGYQPVGQVESYEANHGSLTLSGWGLDPNDRDYSAPVAVILKQDDVEKYNIQLSTNIYLSNSGGNATWRGYHGFQMPATEIDPGTYQLSVLIYNKPGTSGENQYATFSDNTTEKTITILPRQYTVTFHANYDGGAAPAPMSCADNITYPLPSMSRPGYTFAYWQSVDESDSSYDRVTNKSVELKAIWMPGTGTEVDPWRISSLEEWNRFVFLFRGSGYYRYTDTHVRLDTDLTLTKGVLINRGCDFDGNGHTITINISDTFWEGLFRDFIAGSIRNLKVEGIIPKNTQGYNYGGEINIMGGLIGRLERSCTLENCVVSLDFRTTYSASNAYFGGFIGLIKKSKSWDPINIIMRNCVFNGRISGTNKLKAGFIGIPYNSNESSSTISRLQLENCFFAPSSMETKPDYTFCEEYESTNGIYYTETCTNSQGQQVYAKLPDDGVYTILSAAFDNRYYLPQSAVAFSGLSDSYVHTGSPIAISYTVSKDGTPLAANAYTAVFRNAEGEAVASVQGIGQYTLEVTIDGDTYASAFYVTGPLTLTDGIYQINNVADWMTFAADVASGNTYGGSTVRLNADITTDVMVGTDDYKFSGTFDGNGHTLTYNYKSDATTYDPAEDGCAPFRYISGATIRNLTVAGSTVSTGRQMAGLVAYATGDNSISGCVVSASLTSRLSGDTSNGGFVAQLTSGSINFSGCAFNGFLYGTSAHGNGGFVGWSGGTLNFTDCLFSPVYVSMKSSGSSTFARSGSSTFTNTYYTTALGAVQGTLAYTTAQNGLCEKLTMTGDNDIYVVRSSSIEGMAATYYEYNGGSDVTVSGYSVAYNGATLPADKYTVSIRNSANEVVSAPTAIGLYTLTAAGNNSEGYYGSVSKTFWVVKTLATDANGFYLIGNTNDWLSLDYYVKNVPASVDCNVKMTADVSVTTMIGDEAHPFCGMFDGTGHTLTVNLTGSNFVGPFNYANNATFINLHVAGTVRSSVNKAMEGGLVGYGLGNLNIISCRSSADIGRSDWGYAGGFVGTCGGDEPRSITFRDCLFDGTLRGELAVCAGFVGACYSYGANSTETFTNCLMSGTVDTSQGSIVVTYPFHGSATDPVCSNCYHKFASAPSSTNYYPDNQGSYTALTGTALRDKLGSGWTMSGSTVVPNMATLSMRNITVASGIAHGTVECQRVCLPGQTVTVSLTPDENYVIGTVSYNDGTDHLVSPQNGSYSFTMPDADVTVSATFSVSPSAILYMAYNTETASFETHLMPKANATEVTAETTVLGTAGKESWYIMKKNITVYQRMAVYGTVHLILTDGKTMTASSGITVHGGNTLCIYGQEAGTGTLTATGCQVRLGATNESAAIGSEGSNNYTLGTIVIHGGMVNATGYEYTAAIGGGAYNPAGGSIAIYGGTVSATATNPHYRQQEAIGKGDGGVSISKTLADGLCVKVGDDDTPVGYSYRISNLAQKVVTVAPCTEHDWNNNVCFYCGLHHHWQLAYDGNGATNGEVPATATYNLGGDMTATVSGNGSLTRIGYDFNGWNTEADGSGSAYAANATFTISSMVTLYAQWTPTNYTIRYTLDGGNVATPNPTSYTIKSEAITLVNPTRDGYNFMGWTGTDLPRITMNVKIPAGSTGNRAYTATWDEIIPAPEGMAVDKECEPDETGYYYVKMPRPDYWGLELGIDDQYHDVLIHSEDNPKCVTIPEDIHTFKVYDDGGKDEYYFYDIDGQGESTLTLYCPAGKFFRVQGTLETCDNYDMLTIYDGDSRDSEIIYGPAWGWDDNYEPLPVGPFVTSGNCITFYLSADDDHYEGFDLTVEVISQLPSISLVNNDSEYTEDVKNTSQIANKDGEAANVTIDGRMFARSGDWNTLCLPFDIDNIAYSPLKGAIAKTLSTTNYSDGTLTMDFSDNLTSIEAGKPYIMKWDKIDYSATDGTSYTKENTNYARLVDGDKGSEWVAFKDDGDYFCEFETLGLICVTGYTITTCSFHFDALYEYSPNAWELYGKRNLDDEWTLLDSRDTSLNTDDKLPNSPFTDKHYNVAENKQDIYKYFRFVVTRTPGGSLRLSELALEGPFNGIDIVNPTFRNVTIENTTKSVTTAHADFTGTFSSLESTEGRLLDGQNPEGNAMQATIGINYEPTAATGYTFGGWYIDEQRNDAVDYIPFAEDGTVRLYAKWTPNTYQVAFVPNGGSGTMDPQAFAYGTAQTLTANAFTRDGYTFSGWNTETDGTGTAFTDEESVSNLTAEQNGTAVLYAQWTPDAITVTMNGAGIMTYSSEWPLDFSNMTKEDGTELTAYIVSGYNPDAHSIVLTPVTDIPTSTGLLLKGTASADFTVPVQSTAMVYANLLVAVTSAETIVPLTDGTKTNYILANGKYGIDWYTLSEAGSIGANKSYLQLPTSSEVRALTWIFEDETTGIKTAESSGQSADAWYTLDGRKLDGKPTVHGIYINKGKKVVIK